MTAYGYSRRLQEQPFARVCPYCHTAFTTRDPVQKKCKARACARAYDLERQHQERDRMRDPRTTTGLAASCEALEAQLTPENRREWPEIIGRFGWPRTPGYRDLANLTQACVRAKLHLT